MTDKPESNPQGKSTSSKDHASQTFFDGLLQNPIIAQGYFSASKGTKHDAGALRALFNHAGQPLPKDLAETKGGTYEISREKLATLVYKSARNNGSGVVSRATLWLKTRLG